MSLLLGPGVRVTVAPPVLPPIKASPPSPAPAVVVPVRGPAGPQGPPGDAATALAATKDVPAPTVLVQIVHELSYRPAGILCVDTGGQITEPAAITYPSAGITEISFGFPFTGIVYLS